MIDAALERTLSLGAGLGPTAERLEPPRRHVALGDLQTTAERVLRLLDGRGLLGADGWLRPDVRVIAVGDYFDFVDRDGIGIRAVGDHGVRVLGWLAAHPPEQVRLLLGNHDVCRVDELHAMTDARFAEAREAADAVGPAGPAGEDDFRARFPDVPTSGLAARDFRSFHTGQRDLVQRLLLDGRVGLGSAVRLRGRHALVTHAGITTRELTSLGLEGGAEAPAIAEALDRFLATAVAAVRERWEAGLPARLDLDPVHVGGTSGEEGGGLLYHRPSTRTAGWHRHRRRRFLPSSMPSGLVQIAGHTPHGKCLEELALDGPVLPPGRVRVLVCAGEAFRYGVGLPYGEDEGVLHLVDGAIHHPRLDPADAEVLELDGW